MNFISEFSTNPFLGIVHQLRYTVYPCLSEPHLSESSFIPTTNSVVNSLHVVRVSMISLMLSSYTLNMFKFLHHLVICIAMLLSKLKTPGATTVSGIVHSLLKHTSKRLLNMTYKVKPPTQLLRCYTVRRDD